MGPHSDPLGTLLGLSGGLLGALGALLGHSWALLGRSERDKKRKKHGFLPPLLLLGRFWPCLGASWPHLGASRAHLEGSLAVFWYQSLHNLSSCLFFKLCNEWYQSLQRFTSSLGLKLPPGFQERGWESLSTFRLDWLGICWELGVPAPGSNRLGPPRGGGGLREAVYNPPASSASLGRV